MVVNYFFLFPDEVQFFFFNSFSILQLVWLNYLISTASLLLVHTVLENYYFILQTTSKFLLCISHFLKYHIFAKYQQLIDIFVIDFINSIYRFNITYLFTTFLCDIRIIIRMNIKEITPLLSLTILYRNSNWLEREIWDFFGLFVIFNYDLRRLLNDYNFFGFPLRKDFPLSGFFEINYDEFFKILKKTPISFQQKFRLITFLNTW